MHNKRHVYLEKLKQLIIWDRWIGVAYKCFIHTCLFVPELKAISIQFLCFPDFGRS